MSNTTSSAADTMRESNVERCLQYAESLNRKLSKNRGKDEQVSFYGLGSTLY